MNGVITGMNLVNGIRTHSKLKHRVVQFDIRDEHKHLTSLVNFTARVEMFFYSLINVTANGVRCSSISAITRVEAVFLIY